MPDCHLFLYSQGADRRFLMAFTGKKSGNIRECQHARAGLGQDVRSRPGVRSGIRAEMREKIYPVGGTLPSTFSAGRKNKKNGFTVRKTPSNKKRIRKLILILRLFRSYSQMRIRRLDGYAEGVHGLRLEGLDGVCSPHS